MGVRTTAISGMAAVALVAAACGADTSAGSVTTDASEVAGPGTAESTSDGVTTGELPMILATTSIWADVVSNVACGGIADVEALIPAGGDPHSAELSMADRNRMDEATAIVANGLLLEERLEDTIDVVEETGVPVFRMADHIDTIAFGGDGHDEHAEDEHAEDEHAEDEHAEDEHAEDEHGDKDDHGHDGDDPHVWFDPVRVSAALPELGEFLASEGGLDAEAVDACVAAYQEELLAADTEVAELLAAVPDEQRKLVTNHDSLGYFADRYGFDVIGTVIPSSSTLAATNPAQLEELAQLIAELGVPAVFAEAQHSASESQALADRVGEIEVVTLYTGSLGEPGSGAESYIDMLVTDATLIVDALG